MKQITEDHTIEVEMEESHEKIHIVQADDGIRYIFVIEQVVDREIPIFSHRYDPDCDGSDAYNPQNYSLPRSILNHIVSEYEMPEFGEGIINEGSKKNYERLKE